jgi:hypothetical protein
MRVGNGVTDGGSPGVDYVVPAAKGAFAVAPRMIAEEEPT